MLFYVTPESDDSDGLGLGRSPAAAPAGVTAARAAGNSASRTESNVTRDQAQSNRVSRSGTP
jgi:hypothetical protein